MKISKEQAKKFLQELLPDVELVEDDKDADFNEDEAMEAVKASFKDAIAKDLEPEMETKYTGKHLGSLRTIAARNFGITKKDMEGKEVEDILKMVKEKLSTEVGKDANEWKQKHDEAVADYERQLEEKENTWNSKYNTDISAEKQKYVDRDINDAFVALTTKLPRQGGDVVKQARVLRNEAIAQGYEVAYDEAAKSLKLTKDGKPVKVEEVLKTIAADILPLAKDTSHINPKDAKNKQDVGADAIVEKISHTGLMGEETASAINSWITAGEA